MTFVFALWNHWIFMCSNAAIIKPVLRRRGVLNSGLFNRHVKLDLGLQCPARAREESVQKR